MRWYDAFRQPGFSSGARPGFLALCLLLMAAPSSWADVQVTVDQTPIVFEGQPPVAQEGRILVPLRGVLERLGAFVRYNDATRTVTAIRGATNITLPVGSRRAQVGGKPVTLDVPASLVNGSVLVPLRFLSEALGARVTWDVGTQTVAIETQGGDNGTPPAPAAAKNAAPVEVTVEGTVKAIYPDLRPRRLIVTVPGSDGGDDQEKTIPLGPKALISVRRPNSLLAISLDRVKVGDKVEVRETGDGVATAVDVVSRAVAQRDHRSGSGSETKSSDTGGDPETDANTFKGEFQQADRPSPGHWVLKMTDGRSVEVPDSVLVLSSGQKIGVDDLRAGDQVTVAIDPQTKRGTRVVVSVKK